MSVISLGNKAFKKSSCTRRTAFSRTAKFLSRVDLPAAIFPHKNSNFAEVFILVSAYHHLYRSASARALLSYRRPPSASHTEPTAQAIGGSRSRCLQVVCPPGCPCFREGPQSSVPPQPGGQLEI